MPIKKMLECSVGMDLIYFAFTFVFLETSNPPSTFGIVITFTILFLISAFTILLVFVRKRKNKDVFSYVNIIANFSKLISIIIFGRFALSGVNEKGIAIISIGIIFSVFCGFFGIEPLINRITGKKSSLSFLSSSLLVVLCGIWGGRIVFYFVSPKQADAIMCLIFDFLIFVISWVVGIGFRAIYKMMKS